MRFLVTGAKGQLGYDCVRELKKRGFQDVIAIDKDDLDLTNEQDVRSFFLSVRPDVIIHTAAWTSVDLAEKHEAQVRRINVDAVQYIAALAEIIKAKLVYISTDYVFPGIGDKFYDVNDKTGPLNVYGKSKLDGEKCAKMCKKTYIIRVSWVFGINGNNFVKTMLKIGKTNKEVSIVCDQIGSPTYAYDLSRLICDMIETDQYGLYHATNEGVCSWAQFAEEIFKDAELNVNVNHITTNEYLKGKQGQAVRPLNSRLSKKSLDDAGFHRLPTWQDALERFLKEYRL